MTVGFPLLPLQERTGHPGDGLGILVEDGADEIMKHLGEVRLHAARHWRSEQERLHEKERTVYRYALDNFVHQFAA